MDSEVLWSEATLSRWLDKHAKIARVTFFSKRWWNNEVVQAKKTWAKEKKRLSDNSGTTEERKKARNAYYHIIRKAKRECWQNFLQGESNNMSIQSSDKNRCWIALKYTKPQQFKITPTLKDSFGNVATSMKDKETLVWKIAFPPPPKSSLREPRISAGTAHLSITRDHI